MPTFDPPRITVFCGSRLGVRARYAEAAQALGAALARRRLGLVYGGGSVGLMGVLADAVLAGGGEVVGVIPSFLDRPEVAHAGLSELHVVDSMHARKALMVQLGAAFVALPGGLGTLDELFEVSCWAQLGLHGKPVGLLDVDGYWDALETLLDVVVEEGFALREDRRLYVDAEDPDELLDLLAAQAAGRPAAP